MDYRECNFGPSCTCDHRPTLVHGTSPNFSTPNVRGGEPLSLTSPSCTKKEHIDNNLRKKSRGEVPNVRAYDCRMCERVYQTEEELEKHLLNHAEHRPYKCPQCQKGFKQPCHLNQHLRTHTDERPFPCEVCRKSFKQACQLKQHMRLHTGEKPYHCSQCNRSFKQASQLNQHVRLHTGEKPYKCSHCDKTFTQASQLRSHKKTHDPKPERKSMSKKPKAVARGAVVMPTFTTKVSSQSMLYHQKQPTFSPALKMDPPFGGNFKSAHPFGTGMSQVCHMREVPVSSITHDFLG